MSDATVAVPVAKPTPEPTRSLYKFPVYDLADSVAVAKAIHESGGGTATNDQLAAYLGYKSTNNGAFINRIAAAKLFGLIEGPPARLVITQHAQKILYPIQEGDTRQGLIDAFLRVPLFREIYNEYHGKELPPKFGLKNALRTRFGVVPQRIDRAYHALMSSAEAAGFFDVRGSKTQLIIPTIQPAPPKEPVPEDREQEQHRPGGGNGGDGPRGPKTNEELQADYVSALIGLLRQKSEPDLDLMAKIEKLLGMQSGD
ncbi:MAG: hypothetical protein WEE67_00380 [Chloroflexota bacterium]